MCISKLGAYINSLKERVASTSSRTCACTCRSRLVLQVHNLNLVILLNVFFTEFEGAYWAEQKARKVQRQKDNATLVRTC